MSLAILFYLSGVIIALLLFAKKVEVERKRTFILLRAISRGDERVRELSHRSTHLYSEGKEKLIFFLTKQLPLKTKSILNRAGAQASVLSGIYMEKIRGIKRLRSTDQGISEFFRSLADKEAVQESGEGIEKGSQNSEEVVE